ncbi:MAG: OmpA family protein [bacterium]|nr:OmpA family protein [bacterium]
MRRFRVAVAATAGLGLVAGLLATAPGAFAETYPPSPSPTATATPTITPTPTPSPSVTPEPTPTETILPSPPPAGGAIVTVSGNEVQATVTVNRADGTVEVSSGDLEVIVDPKAADGANLPIDVDGTPIVNAGGDIVSSGRGFASGTPVNFYLIRDGQATYLGTLDVQSDGTFAGSVPIPADLAPGNYTLQVNGLTESTRFRALVMRVISINILVRVTPAKRPSELKAVRTIVYFDVFSAKLLPSAKRQLDTLVKRLPTKRSNFVRVIGFVGPGGSALHVKALSAARAASVARYLRSKGVKGTYQLKIGGNAKINAPSARRASVLVVPNKGR